MEEKEIRVRTRDGEMTTFIVHPDGPGPYPVADLPVYNREAAERHFERTLDLWGRKLLTD